MTANRKWAAWLTGTLGVFAALEAQALKAREPGKPSGTLTATMRLWIGMNPRHWRRFILAPMFSAFCAYLFLHFIGGRFNA